MNKGVVLIILSGLSFLIVNFFVKLLGSDTSIGGMDFQRYPAHELVLSRSIVSFAISAYIVKKRQLPFFGNNKKWLIIRGISGTIALTIFFYTIHHLPLAVASTIQYLSPIFTVLLAIAVLGERVLKMQWLFIGISFIGVILISVSKLIGDENSESISLFWLGLGLVSSMFSGIAYTAIVKLRPTDAPIQIVMYFPMIAIPIMTVFCYFDFVWPQGVEWLFLLAIGIFTQMAQILLTRALHTEDTSVIMPFQYLGAIYAFLVGYFVFNESLSMMIDLGILLILAGVVTNVVIRKRKQNP